jgi:predicted esterase
MRGPRSVSERVLTAFFAGALLACAHGPPKRPGQLFNDVVFDRYSTLSSNDELLRRMMTPLTQKHGREMLLSTHQKLRDQAIDLSKEKFTVYVPAGDPPKEGYGLLVFVAPWEVPTKPNFWRPALDKHQFLFVSATGSGNEMKVYDRRMPLALLAYENMRARYPVNPQRVYIGGLSGGSRVAEMTALGYPDVFRGALLNAGADPIGGNDGIHLPRRELFDLFQRMRIVFITGEHDEQNVHDDLVARVSMRDRCVFNVEVRVAPRLGHEPLSPEAFAHALDDLEKPADLDEQKLAECNRKLYGELQKRLDAVRAAIDDGDRKRARDLLSAIDTEYSGLAASQIEQLDDALRSSR